MNARNIALHQGNIYLSCQAECREKTLLHSPECLGCLKSELLLKCTLYVEQEIMVIPATWMQEVDIKSLKAWRTILRWLLTHFTHAYKIHFSVYGQVLQTMPALQLWYYINCISQTWIYLPWISTFLFIKKIKSILFWQLYERASHINLLFLNLNQ